LAEEIKEGPPKEESTSEDTLSDAQTLEKQGEKVSKKSSPEGSLKESVSEGETPPKGGQEEPEEGSAEEGAEPSFRPEDSSAESSEELIKALEEEVSQEEPSEPLQKKKGKFVTILLILGLAVGLAGIGGGLYTLRKILKRPSVRAKTFEKKSSKGELKKPLGEPSKGPLFSQPIKPVLEYSVVLKHFLIPLQSEGGAPIFIKATVVLYFENQREVLLAQKLENPLRGIIFDTLKNIPFYYWQSQEGISKVRGVLLETLKKRAPGGLRPKYIEITGYILK